MARPTKKSESIKSVVKIPIDPTECPFREFRDNELSTEYWGLGPAAFRVSSLATTKAAPKSSPSSAASTAVWVDDQTQPLPRSVRHYLHGWRRAEDLALDRWETEVAIFEDNNGSKMSVIDIQMSHTQVLMRSSFCRRVLSACYMLEKTDGVPVEHLWENFAFSFGPEGWRAKYHIYSPGSKSGGGAQHRPGLSKNGCYLVRLYFLGCWRCVWVNDQVPVDANDSPLLPFSPLMTHAPAKLTPKQIPANPTSPVVHLWPLLICKALLKLAVPDMNSDEDTDGVEDEVMPEFDILHALTGSVSLVYHVTDLDELWKLITTEVPVFSWDDDDETVASTIKSKSKKPSTKETTVVKRSMLSVEIDDTKNHPPYTLPGITPGLQMNLIVAMARDLPLKRPLPEPDVSPWKHYRWVEWARHHGLYGAYDCPRTKFLKVNGLLKLSYAPHLLDVQSTESTKKPQKEQLNRTNTAGTSGVAQNKDELREWVQFEPIQQLVKTVNVLYFPSMFEYTSAASSPPIRTSTKVVIPKAIDIVAPKAAPLYLQIDGPEENLLRISLSMLHPRVLLNVGVPVLEYIERAYLILEVFEWFVDCDIPMAKAFIQTRGYDSVEVAFKPGRHFCRLWVHSRMNWHVALLSESTLLLGTRDVIQTAAIRECPWAARFLQYVGASFSNWIRVNRSSSNILFVDREFYASYQPDLFWDPKVVGYNRSHLHWMFRQALQSLLYKKLQPNDFETVCMVLRRYFCDPDFGHSPKPAPPKSLREIVTKDPCDCIVLEVEDLGETEEEVMEEQITESEQKPLVSSDIMDQLLAPPSELVVSQVCELATAELPCGLLKEERDKVIIMHEAATFIQAHWRGAWARKCLKSHVVFNSEITKYIMESAFGNLEALSGLMNEFFAMFPGAKLAYSVASALSGVYGLHQHTGISPVSPKCKWIPYFQGVFYCHAPVKVHFDIQSTIQHTTVAIYNNDTGEQMPQAYNAHITFDFAPNNFGYTVMGHGTLNQATGVNGEVHWQLTVHTSIDNMFHVCDNHESEICTLLPLPPAAKLRLDEIYIPNRRHILGGIQIAVTKIEAVRFRAATTSPDLEIEAILRTTNSEGDVEEIARCHGKGEIYWPYISLKPAPPGSILKQKRSISHANLNSAASQANMIGKGKGKQKPNSAGKARSATKMKDMKPAPQEPKIYTIEVVAPNGWPLPMSQWKRIDEVRNMLETPKVDIQLKKPTIKEKGGSAKKEEKEKEREPPKPLFTVQQPLADDAYTELECSTAIGGGTFAKRDDERDLMFASARRSWDAKEPGRSLRGAQIRQEFRSEFLVAIPQPSSKVESVPETYVDEAFVEEYEGDEEIETNPPIQQGPTPVSESGLLEISLESAEEAIYYTMPEQLKDKFVPLHFAALCTKEKSEDESVLLTSDMAEAAKKERIARTEAAVHRMKVLQAFNETCVLERQKKRWNKLEKLFVDSQWTPELTAVLEERDASIAREILERSMEASKKKLDSKKK